VRVSPLISAKRRTAHAAALLDRLQELLPNARCELFYQTPYQLLVSVVLSAQTTDKMVNKVMQPLYEAGFKPETVLALGAEGFLERIRSIGLAPTKAKNVYRLSQILLESKAGEVPASREELEALPGVGRKTANVILGEIFRAPTLAVDTHVFRVTRRLGLQDEATPEKAELALLDLIDPSYLPRAHHWFILHGRYTCKALRPACSNCALRDLCPSAETTIEEARAAGQAAKSEKHSRGDRGNQTSNKRAAKASTKATQTSASRHQGTRPARKRPTRKTTSPTRID
jgi:endonuclease-3